MKLNQSKTLILWVTELALPPVKVHCSVLAEDAIKAAIEDYRGKKSKAV